MEKRPPVSLYLVATPIGNLGDLSPRAAKTLEEADFIAAEDTRNTLKLLNHIGVKKPLVSYFEHNRRERGEEICARLLNGEVCALVTDAGTPAISDPGEELVARCHELGLGVSAIPGPCALIAALAVSGLPTGRFSFEGFLSTNGKTRREHLALAAKSPYTLIFYEAPHKLKRTIIDLYKALGDRRLTLARELTKPHEEIIRTTLAKAVSLYEDTKPRGEYVLVVEGRPQTPRQDESSVMQEALNMARDYLEKGVSKSEAVRLACARTGARKNELYRLIAAMDAPKQEKAEKGGDSPCPR